MPCNFTLYKTIYNLQYLGVFDKVRKYIALEGLATITIRILQWLQELSE